MEKIYNSMAEKLDNLKKELAQRLEHFKIMVENESGTGCFEQNAINDLLVMKDLKAEIKDLEHWEKLMRFQLEK